MPLAELRVIWQNIPRISHIKTQCVQIVCDVNIAGFKKILQKFGLLICKLNSIIINRL